MSKIIKLLAGTPEVVADDWQIVRDADAIDRDKLAHTIVPFTCLSSAPDTPSTSEIRAVWIAPDDAFEAFMPLLLGLELIAIDFPSFRDGRGYSVATLLRSRYA